MIFYAGNILSKHGYTPTFIESLTPKFSEHYSIISVSDKKNQIVRLADMITDFLKNKKKIKLVLIDSYSLRAFWFTYALAVLSRQYKIPYIPILRGGGYPERLQKSKKLCDYIFTNSARNISPSLYLKDQFEKCGYKTDYIPNFINIKNYKFTERTSIKPTLLWVRSFDRTYNPLMAIEIIKLLKIKYPDAKLCMVGPDKDGSMNDVLKLTEKYGLTDSVVFTGKKSKREWAELSEQYDIFINTTDYDNHPVSVIEAMALGLPVVSTDVGGIPFLIEDERDGLLTKPGDAVKFTEKIEILIKDNALAKNISLNARKKAVEFDWERVKEKWFEVINPYLKHS